MQIGKIVLLATFVVSVSGCSFSDKYAKNTTDDDEYVYIVDYEKMAKISTANYYSPAFVKTVWVNYPKKRVKKSEIEYLK